MLGDIIVDILDADMEVVAALSDRAEMLRYVHETNADLVILGMDDAELPDESARIFDVHPKIKVMGIVGGGRTAYLYELRPSRSSLGEVSAEGLVEAIRRALRAETPPSR